MLNFNFGFLAASLPYHWIREFTLPARGIRRRALVYSSRASQQGAKQPTLFAEIPLLQKTTPWNGQEVQATYMYVHSIKEEYSLEDITADDDQLPNDGQTGEL